MRCLSMLPFRVFANLQLRRSPNSYPGPTPIPCPQSPNPFAINPFADPHLLTPIAPIFYKNIGGHGITRVLRAPQRGGTSASYLQPGIVQNPVAHPPVFSITCEIPFFTPFFFIVFPFWGGGGGCYC